MTDDCRVYYVPYRIADAASSLAEIGLRLIEVLGPRGDAAREVVRRAALELVAIDSDERDFPVEAKDA